MAPNSGEPDAAALRDRVKQLEQTVADQQATIESLQPSPASRRGVLAALTGVAGAGALGAYSQRASAQAAGQVGTSSEPVDVEAYDLNVQGTANGLVQNPLTGDLDAGGNSLTNVAAVETDKIAVTESGVVDHGTVSADSGSRVSVTFNESFNSAPTIIHEIGETGETLTTSATSSVRDVDKSGFVSQVFNPPGADRMIDHVGYLAVIA